MIARQRSWGGVRLDEQENDDELFTPQAFLEGSGLKMTIRWVIVERYEGGFIRSLCCIKEYGIRRKLWRDGEELQAAEVERKSEYELRVRNRASSPVSVTCDVTSRELQHLPQNGRTQGQSRF